VFSCSFAAQQLISIRIFEAFCFSLELNHDHNVYRQLLHLGFLPHNMDIFS
jgi:hypothetical protein